MEKINEILSNIKERFSNPIIFSFICSWLIINWQITIGLFICNSGQIQKEGYATIFSFIKEKVRPDNSLWLPLILAIGYTFLMPILRNIIRAFYAWISKWGENWNLKILNQSKISFNKYFKLRDEYEKRSKILEDVISKESEYVENYNSMQTELLATKNTLNENSKRLNESTNYILEHQDIQILNGNWECNYVLENTLQGKEEVFIENGIYSIVSDLGFKEAKYDIKDFFYDNRDKKLFFIKEPIRIENASSSKKKDFKINRLKFESNDLLVGNENNITQIVYRRK